MSYTVVVDTSKADALLNQFRETTSDLSTGLLQAVEETFIPDIVMLSQAIWNVRTGQYSNGWIPEAAGGNMVTVTNTAEAISDGYPYSFSLEYGWKGRAGGFVAQQAVEGSASAIGQALLEWVMSQLP